MKSERMERLLDIIAGDPLVNKEELDRRLEIDGVVIGDESEENVTRVVGDLWFVSGVRRTVRGGKHDVRGRDVIVSFENGELVYIQVKSSRKGMKKFIDKRGFDANALNAERIVLINGRCSDDSISVKFMQGVIGIDDYWIKNHNEPILPPLVRESLRFIRSFNVR